MTLVCECIQVVGGVPPVLDALLRSFVELIQEDDPDVRRRVLFLARDPCCISDHDGERLITLVRITTCAVLHCSNDLTECLHFASVVVRHRSECAAHHCTDFL